MEEKHSSALTTMNIITTIFLGLFTLYVAFNVFSDGYQFGPSIVWIIVSDALRSGMLEVNGEGAALSAILCFFPLGIWCLVPLLLSLIAYGRKKPSAQKSTIMWASMLLGVVTLIIIGLFAISHFCVPETLTGSSPVCRLPLRPGVVVPTPSP